MCQKCQYCSEKSFKSDSGEVSEKNKENQKVNASSQKTHKWSWMNAGRKMGVKDGPVVVQVAEDYIPRQ